MRRLFWGGLAIAVIAMLGSEANASCPAFTTFSNGQTADAGQVMGNFNYILECPVFTGNVGIGYASTSVKLLVYANLDGNIQQWVGNGYSTTFGMDITGAYLYHNSAIRNFSLGSNSSRMQLVLAANGEVGIGTASPSYTFYVNGSAGGTQAWQSPSDVRLKKDIVPIEGALGIIEQLQGVRFNWRSPDERSVGKDLKLPLDKPQVGFIAQNLQKVLPEAISVSNDHRKLMSVSESKVVPVLVEAVKNLVAMNRKQSTQIQSLEARVTSLERKATKRTANSARPNVR